MKRFVVCFLVASVVACTATNPRPDEDVLNPDAPPWVYDPSFEWDPDEEPLAFYATGRGRRGLNLNLAEEEARSDALSDLRSFLEVTIERLNENYAAEAGDLLDKESLSSFVNNEMFTREVVSGTVNGYRVRGTWWDAENFYVWLRFDADQAFFVPYQNSVAAKLRKRIRELTTADKERMRAELERVVAEHNSSE